MYLYEDNVRRIIREELKEFFNRPQNLNLDSPEPLNISQVAKRYGVSKQTIHNWIKRGKIESYKIGKDRFFDVVEVERNKKDAERDSNREERRNRFNDIN